MVTIHLANPTGNSRVDECLRAFIALIEVVFPQRMRAYYLLGSYADNTAVPTSDVDLFVVSKEPLNPAEHELYGRIAHQCSLLAGILFQTGVVDEAHLGGRPDLATSRLFVYGEDVGDRIPPLQPGDSARKALSSAVHVLCELHDQPPPLAVPLTYPDPEGEFFGYERNGMPAPGGWNGPGTKKLINAVSMAAGALVAIQCGQAVMRRSDCVAMYRSQVGDVWSDFVEQVCAFRTPETGYAMPVDGDQRKRLRRFCAEMPAFENHFLQRYGEYLLAQLDSRDDVQKRWAVEQLAAVKLPS
jgi:Nucleotidyltransferase domain